MRLRSALVLASLVASVPALAAERVEVTRFHTVETIARLGPGAVDVVPAPGVDGASLESRVWLDAVARELSAQGFAANFTANGSSGAPRVAEVRLTRDVVEGSEARRRTGSSVSIGVGSGWGGGWHRGGGTHVGVGVGLGLPVGGSRDREQVESELSVTIRDKASGAPLWEGRSSVRTGTRSADSAQISARLARALFADFPGRSGATIEVR
ncbi:MAG TPA: DUF4136 domain-containing protein [Novosphingobium sp.]|nr:DUF4136 domain-containing protein [Novosphingobium sp.]